MPSLATMLGGPPAPASQVLRGRVRRTPASDQERLVVSLDSISTEIYEVPAGNWAPRGAELPQQGALCLVCLDEFGEAYVPIYTGPNEYGGGGGGSSVIAGAGLTKTGDTVDVVAGAGTGLQVNSDNIQIAVDGITDTMMGDSSVNLGSSAVYGQLPITKGGHGGTTASAGRNNLGAAGYYSTATHGAGTTIAIVQATHGLRAWMGLIVQVQHVATGAVEVPEIVVSSGGDVTVTFAVSVAANSKRVTIVG